MLSLGCGHGVVDRYLAEVNPDVAVVGVELDRERVEVAARTQDRCPRVTVRPTHDRIVSGPDPIHCREPDDMAAVIAAAGFDVDPPRRLRRLGIYPQYLVLGVASRGDKADEAAGRVRGRALGQGPTQSERP